MSTKLVPLYGSFEVEGPAPKDGLCAGMAFAIMVEPEFCDGQLVSLRSRNYRFVVEERDSVQLVSLQQAKQA